MGPSRPGRTEEDAQLEGLKAAVVVMIDDEPTTLDVLEMFLYADGYREVVKIADPRKALEMIEGIQPDLVLLNLMMPQVSGLEILEALRADPSLCTIPAIIITGSSDADLKRKAFELGAADFLAKPVDPSELALRMRNTLATRAFRDGGMPRAFGGQRDDGPVEPAAREDRVRTIVDTFLSRLEPRIGAIEEGLERGDLEGVAELAHWLKGAAGTVGLHDFTAPAETLGRLAKKGDVDAMRPIVKRIRTLSAEASAEADG